MKTALIARLYGDFEQAAHDGDGDGDGVEYWCARGLQPVLGYARWENFEQIIQKAVIACQIAGYPALDHFRDVTKMAAIGSGTDRKIDDLGALPPAEDVKMVERRLKSDEKRLPSSVAPKKRPKT